VPLRSATGEAKLYGFAPRTGREPVTPRAAELHFAQPRGLAQKVLERFARIAPVAEPEYLQVLDVRLDGLRHRLVGVPLVRDEDES